MVFKHNNQPFNGDQFDALSYDNLKGLENNSQLLSLTEISSSKNAVGKTHIADFVKENIFGNSEEESRPGHVVLKDSSANSFGNHFGLSWLASTGSEAITSEHGKRTLSDVKPCQVACKRPKQMDQTTQLCSSEDRPFVTALEASTASALGDEFVETGEPNHIPEHTANTSCCIGSGWPCSTCKHPVEEESLYSPAWAASFPSYFEDYEQVAGYDEADDIESPVHEFLPRKPVPIGPDHQADIPDWRPRDFANDPSGSRPYADLPHNSEGHSESAVPFVDDRDDDSDSEKWISASVMPMPESDSDSVVGTVYSKVDCVCSDEGSIRCVRQHVMEARENLKRRMGEDKFNELGLGEMGEDVALKWTEEEERLFQEVVFSNPASLGKNFWYDLPFAFPDKTSKELVSYYFNVFMLRKRAQQNRSQPMHVDSDDDELPEINEGEPAVTEQEEEDSAVESPTDGHCFDHRGEHIEDVHEGHVGDDFYEFSFSCKGLEGETEAGCPPDMRPVKTNLENFVEDPDIQDESCTSFEGQHNRADFGDQASMAQNGIRDNHEDFHDDVSAIAGNGLFDEHCDPKTWDVSFVRGKQGEEFLSTCNVIEEVIGLGANENSAMDGHRVG